MSIPLEIPLIQVAGIHDRAEAVLLRECGIHYLGFPLRLPVHREDLTEAEAADILRSLRPPARGVLITYLDEAGAIAEFCRALGARTVQLHGDISTAELERLRELDPWLTIIKSLVVGRHAVSVLERLAVELAPLVDGFITDTYAPETGASGATGRTHEGGAAGDAGGGGEAGGVRRPGTEGRGPGRGDRFRPSAVRRGAAACRARGRSGR